ncbi:FkbM family methyltransferase [Pedobacter chitinilyticus]|nr:FkbM family methyltransferase [Pedobacter chitinilyticus]
MIKPFIGNVNFYAKKRLTGITGNIYVGLHEFNDMGFLLHFLREEDLFFDIGANVGSYTLLASGHVGAKTIAFEPIPHTFEILSKNVSLNRLESKVTLCNKALGSKIGIIEFTSNLDTVNHVISNDEDKNDVINVEVSILDEFIESDPILLKIDVEGFETEVIKGGKKVLENKRLKAIIIELNGSGNRYNYKEEDIHNYFISMGFTPYLYDPLKREFKQASAFGAFNTIYIRDIDFVKNRCNSAKIVTILGISF